MFSPLCAREIWDLCFNDALNCCLGQEEEFAIIVKMGKICSQHLGIVTLFGAPFLVNNVTCNSQGLKFVTNTTYIHFGLKI